MKRLLLASLLVCASALSSPIQARAFSGDVLLAFAASYTAPDGTTSTHRGIDVATGEDVTAPRGGTVRFAGRIPGPNGGTVLALTLDTVDGMVTMLPFDRLSAVEGARVAEGDELGTLASSGDPSSPGRHLHLGVKRGGVYLDPAFLLAPIVTKGSDPQSEPQVSTNVQPSPAAASSPVMSVPSAAGGPVGTAQGVGVTPQSTPVQQPVPGAQLSPGVSVATPAVRVASAEPVVANVTPLTSKAVIQPNVSSVRQPASARAPFSLGAPGTAAGVLAIVLFGSALLLTRRTLALRVSRPPVSDRLGNLLQHLKAGDTLCGLTSCSGPLPSQSRGH